MPVGWKISSAMATSDGCFIFLCSVVGWSSEYLMIHPPLVFQDGMEQMGSLKSQLRAALADRDDAIQVCVCHRNAFHRFPARRHCTYWQYTLLAFPPKDTHLWHLC